MGIGSVAVQNRGRQPRVDELINIYRFPEKAWVTLRFIRVAPENKLAVAQHWFETWKEDGGTARFSKNCIGVGEDDNGNAKVYMDNCPYCTFNGEEGRLEYYYNAIVRELQANEPARQAPWTDGENATYYKDKNSKSWTPVVVVRLTGNMIERIQKFIQLRNGNEPEDPEKGFDISVYYDSKAKTKADTYQFQIGDNSPLTEAEWIWDDSVEGGGYCAYLIHDLTQGQPQNETYEQAQREMDRIAPNLKGAGAAEDDGSGSAGGDHYASRPAKGGKGGRATAGEDYGGYEGGGFGSEDMDMGGGNYAPPAKGAKGGKAPAPGGKGARPAPPPADEDGYGEDQYNVPPPAAKGAKGGKAAPGGYGGESYAPPAKGGKAPAPGGKGGAPAAKGAFAKGGKGGARFDVSGLDG